MIDCLFVGMNSQEFTQYLDMVRGLGEDGGAYRDLNLSFIEYEGRPQQAMDLLTQFYKQDGGQRSYPFHNADFVWPTITYLGTFLSRNGLTFDFVNSFQFEKEALREKLENEDILSVVIPTTLYVVPWPIQEIVSFVRQYNSRTKIIIGGPYIANVTKSGDSEFVKNQLRTLDGDFYVVNSEGEQALTALLHTLKSGGELARVDNLVYRSGNDMVFTKSIPERNSLEDNMVDYSLFSPEVVGQFVSTRTAKSCPFACAFCNFPQQAGKYTYMSVDMVERELDAIRDIGSVTTVTFIDDTFNVPRKRFHAILEMMIRNGYSRDFKWNATLRSDHADDETISLMAKAGCEGVFLGVESGSDRMLKQMNKTARRKDYLRVIPRLREEGILGHVNTFIGFPGETMESVEETVELITETKPETFSTQPWYANPLTPVWKKREEYGIQGSSFKWSHDTMDAETACDLVDRTFLTLDESIFLPQYGFFQWSLFYLQRQGMHLDSIKQYLRAFNALVRERIVGQVDERSHEQLIRNLKDSARFDQAEGLETAAITADSEAATNASGPREAVNLYSGASRVAAERYCATAFGEIDTATAASALERSIDADTDTEPASVAVELPDGGLSSVAIFAAYAIVLWRLNELTAVPVIANLSEPVPLLVRPHSDETFETWVATTEDSLHEARRHRQHTFDLLKGRSRISPFHNRPPRFRAAFDLGPADQQWSDGFENYRSDVLLTASFTAGNQPSLLLHGRNTIEGLESVAHTVSSIVERTQREPQLRIAELATTDASPQTTDERLRAETFTF